jgi:deoxycytidine triphosphate deaminase
MLISPKIAIKEGWVTWNEVVTDIEKHVQPNALDFDCARIFRPETYSTAYLSETKKQIRKYTEMEADVKIGEDPAWELINGQGYDFSSNFHVTLPEGVAAQLIIRSTLNRSGVFLTSGLYDSGFSGQVAGVLRISNGHFTLAKNTRIGQIMFIKSDAGGLYAGGYNHAAGTHYTEAQQKH